MQLVIEFGHQQLQLLCVRVPLETARASELSNTIIIVTLANYESLSIENVDIVGLFDWCTARK